MWLYLHLYVASESFCPGQNPNKDYVVHDGLQEEKLIERGYGEGNAVQQMCII